MKPSEETNVDKLLAVLEILNNSVGARNRVVFARLHRLAIPGPHNSLKFRPCPLIKEPVSDMLLATYLK